MALFTEVLPLCTFNIVATLICHHLPNVWKASYTISASIFIDVPYLPLYSKVHIVLYPGPRSGSFTLAKRSYLNRMDSGENDDTWWYRTPAFLHDTARSHTAAVKDLMRRWLWEILEHPPYSPDKICIKLEVGHEIEVFTCRWSL